MKNIILGKTNISVPAISVGCMRLNSLDENGATDFVATQLKRDLLSLTMPIFTATASAKSCLLRQ